MSLQISQQIFNSHNNKNVPFEQNTKIRQKRAPSIILPQKSLSKQQQKKQKTDLTKIIEINNISQQFLCYICTNIINNNNNKLFKCKQCNEAGYVNYENPMVQLINTVINMKFSVDMIGNDIQNQEEIDYYQANNSFQSDLLYLSQSQSPSLIAHLKPQTFLKNSRLHKNNKIKKNIKSNKIIKNSSDNLINLPILQTLKKINPPHSIIKQQSYRQDIDQQYQSHKKSYHEVKQMDIINENQNIKKMFQIQPICVQYDQDFYNIKAQNKFQNQQNIFHIKQIEQINNKQNNQNLQQIKVDQKQHNFNNFNGFQINNYKQNIQNNINFKCDQNSINQIDSNYNNIQLVRKKSKNSKQNYKSINQKECSQCHQNITQFYWVCQICKQQNQKHLICKDCYDKQQYSHNDQHLLFLNFLNQKDKNQKSKDEQLKYENSLCRKQSKININIDNSSEKSSQLKSPLTADRKAPHLQQFLPTKSEPQIAHKDIFLAFSQQNGTSPKKNIKKSLNNPIQLPQLPSLDFSQSITPQMLASYNSLDDLQNKIRQSQNNQTCINKNFKIKQVNKINQYNKSNKSSQQKILNNQDNHNRLKLFSNSINTSFININNNNSKINRNKKIIPRNDSTTTLDKLLNQNIKHFQENYQIQNYKNYNNYSQKSINNNLNKQAQVYYFYDYKCDICGIQPIQNRKYKCLKCQDYDLCEKCYLNTKNQHPHQKWKIQNGKEKYNKKKQHQQQIINKIIKDHQHIHHKNPISPLRKSVRHMI